MVARKNGETNGHWSKSTTAIAAYVVAIATGVNQGITRVTVDDQDRFTATQQKEYVRHMEAEVKRLELERELLREELKAYSDKNAEQVALKMHLHLAENYLDKNEIPPNQVTDGLARSEEFQRTMALRMQSQDERTQQLSDRITRCCYSFENSAFETIQNGKISKQ